MRKLGFVNYCDVWLLVIYYRYTSIRVAILWRSIWRYKRVNQKSYIQLQTIKWPKRKRTKWQTMINKKLIIKLKIEQNEPHQKPWMNSGWSTNCTLCATLVVKREINHEWRKDRIVITASRTMCTINKYFPTTFCASLKQAFVFLTSQVLVFNSLRSRLLILVDICHKSKMTGATCGFVLLIL